MKSYIIGIAGTKNSGKDTVASMINYMFAIGVSNASYGDWLIKRTSYNNTFKDRIIHFADGLKDVLSIIYNIPRPYFDNRKYKDELWYNIKAGTFIDNDEIIDDVVSTRIYANMLQKHALNCYMDYTVPDQVYIKLRTLMQYFGTDLCRNQLDDNIWIRQTMNKAVDIAESRKLCIIPDVRFVNEADAIFNNGKSLYGGLILIKRDNCNEYEHESENINFFINDEIDNNGSLMQLFYQVLQYVQSLI